MELPYNGFTLSASVSVAAGIFIEVKLLHWPKAVWPIVETVSGTSMLVILEES